MATEERREQRARKFVRDFNALPHEVKKSKYIDLIKKKRMSDINYPDKFNNMESIYSSLDEVVGDNWDIVLTFYYIEGSYIVDSQGNVVEGADGGLVHTYKTMFNGGIVIHYDKFNIRNSKNMVHEINDMYIQIVLGRNLSDTEGERDITISTLRGYRHSATKRELMSSYAHSHIGGGDCYRNQDVKFSGFCTGTGEINQTIARLRSKYNSGIFKLFLFQITPFLEWESLEGRPHMYISNVLGRANVQGISQERIKNFVTEMTRYFEENPNNKKEVNFKLHNGNIVVKDDSKFEDFLKYKGNEVDSYRLNDVVAISTKGEYYSIVTVPEVMPTDYLYNQEHRSFHFREELREFKIVEPNPENSGGPEFYIHPKIKQYVKYKIEDTVQKERIASCITKELNPS